MCKQCVDRRVPPPAGAPSRADTFFAGEATCNSMTDVDGFADHVPCTYISPSARAPERQGGQCVGAAMAAWAASAMATTVDGDSDIITDTGNDDGADAELIATGRATGADTRARSGQRGCGCNGMMGLLDNRGCAGGAACVAVWHNAVLLVCDRHPLMYPVKCMRMWSHMH